MTIDAHLSRPVIGFASIYFLFALLAVGCVDSVGGEASGEDARSQTRNHNDPVRAARTGDLKTLRRLVEKTPAVLKATTGPRETLLHVAANKNRPEVVEYLVLKGIDVDVRNGMGETPLHRAASAGSLDAVKVLVRLGADPNIRNNDGETPLDLAGKLDEFVVLNAFASAPVEAPKP